MQHSLPHQIKLSKSRLLVEIWTGFVLQNQFCSPVVLLLLRDHGFYRIVPWQTNSIFIINHILMYLASRKLPIFFIYPFF